MDLTKTILQVIDTRSFSSLWYWIMLAVVWSSASHWVLGVPFDMIQRARRNPGPAEDELYEITRLNVGRILYIADTAGIWLAGFSTFILSALLLLAFWYDIEFAQAVLFLFFPFSILMALTLRTSLMIEAGEGQGEALHRRLHRHRLSTQVLGMVSIFVTSLFGMYQNMHIGVLG